MRALNRIIAKLLHDVANRFDADTSEVSDAEAVELVSMLTHRIVSKEQACLHLNLSRSKFDEMIREKKLPKGRKKVGFKELCWYQDELDDAVKKISKKNIK